LGKFPLVNGMGIHHNLTGLSLSEYLSELNHWY